MVAIGISIVCGRLCIFCSLLMLHLLVVASATACNGCINNSNATLYPAPPFPIAGGACGYGSLAAGFNGGRLAAVSPSLYKQGAACGTCFQISCKEKGCSEEGTTVMVTHQNLDKTAEFVLSRRALEGLANKGQAKRLPHLLPLQYKRVACDQSEKKNLSIHVQEWSSQSQQFLSISFLDQGGETEIVAVDVGEVGAGWSWKYMSRSTKYGGVWETSNVPKGALQFRFVVTSGYDGKYYWAKHVLPADWKPGFTYDSGLQITDVARQPCSPCA